MGQRSVRRRAAVGKRSPSLKGGGQRTRKHSKAGRKETPTWKVFVYLAGDNNLSDEMIWSLLGMQAAAEDPRFKQRVELTAVYDPSGRAPLVYEFPAQNGHDPATVGLRAFGGDRSPLAGLNGLSTFDQLSHFVDQQLDDPRRYPPGVAVPTMIVLSGHGNGVAGMLAEDRRDGPLLVPQLGKLLELATARRRTAGGAPGKVKILGLEACAMGIIELCYEVRASVEVVIGTESFVENNGWPYERILKPFLDETLKDAKPVDIAVAMAKVYSQYYREYDIGDVSTDISVISLESIESALAGPIRELGALMCDILRPAENEREESSRDAHEHALRSKSKADTLLDALVVAHWRAQSYSMDAYVDLEDWIVQLQRALRNAGLPEVVKKSEEVRKGLAGAVKAAFYQGPAFQHSNGLSIYLPGALSRYNPGYEDLAFDRDTRWSDFVKLYLQRSQRGVRKEPNSATLYTYEAKNAPVNATQVPGSVRNPPNGSKRSDPPHGPRTADRPDGFFKNGPRDWYRDPRDGSSLGESQERKETVDAVAVVP